MSMYFKSFASSSGGNCLALWTDRTAILIDCGLGSMKRTRQMLTAHNAAAPPVSAVLVSHLHSDHIGYYPLRVFEQLAVPVHVHAGSVEPLRQRHFNGYGFGELALEAYADSFSVGDLSVEPIAVSHSCPTFGFVIRCRAADRWIKAVIATDFNRPDDISGHLVDADFIFIESNHDLALLKQYYNPNSRYHMPNPKTAELLARARMQSKRAPAAVMLGHLSAQRNRPKIAIAEIENHFKQQALPLDFQLLAAPQKEASETVHISGEIA
ncbi:MAG: MBL fold metallo-hydrolase [Phycisphaerae bacterium]|nr:MBL fold metallo-hydrolase [Phycisphaerae bacterium]